jgi:hypothetical protein
MFVNPVRLSFERRFAALVAAVRVCDEAFGSASEDGWFFRARINSAQTSCVSAWPESTARSKPVDV